MTPDRELDVYAARQYGAFSRDQAVTVGFTAKMIHNRVGGGAWIRLAPSVYAVASAPPKWERQMAAALLSRPGSVVAGHSAAHLHDFAGFGIARPVIMVDTDGNARSPLARVIRSERLASVSTVRKRGFTVTDEADTIMTLAATLPSGRIEATVDEVLARKTMKIEQLGAVVAANRGARGAGKLRPIVQSRLPDAYQPPTTELERLLYRLLDDPHVPRYTRQLPIALLNVDATVDAYIPVWRLIVEGDGRRWHTRKADHDRDRLRDNEATAHGYAVLRFTYEMLRDRRQECLETLLRTGRVRSAS